MSNLPRAGRILRRMLPAMILIAAAGATCSAARAEYPERQITMIVCFPAGGGTDIAARLINTPLGEALGKPVIIENRGGAGGNIGIAAAARAGGDGYTLLVCSSAYVVNPSLYAQVTYDPFKDFLPVMVIGASPNVFVLPAQSELKSLPELIAKAKANPGKLNWTSAGVGTTPYLAGEVLKIRAGIEMQHIPFAGAGPALTAVLGGQLDMFTANYGSMATLIEDGKLRPIAVTSKARAGIRVIELANFIAGPLCGTLLADMGADVVKVEPPQGDMGRATPPIRNDESVSFTALNRNKRSLVLDLKRPEAQEVIRKLAAKSDVLVEAYRPGALEKMGLGAEQIKAVNPRIIYTSVSGFGQTGPHRRRAGVNLIIE